MKRLVNRAFAWGEDNLATAVLTPLGIVLVVAVAVVGIRGQEVRNIVQGNPCVISPAGEACQKSKRQSDKQRSISDTCIGFHRVGYVCPKGDPIRSTPAATRGEQTGRSEIGAPTSEVPDGAAGTGAPANHGGVDDGHGQGGDDDAGAGPDPQPAPEPAPSPSPGGSAPGGSPTPEGGSTQTTTPTPPNEKGLITSTLETVGATAQETVKKTTDSTNALTCSATALLHPCP